MKMTLVALAALLAMVGCEEKKSAQERVAEYQLAEIQEKQRAAQGQLDKFKETDFEKLLSFECAQQWRRAKAVSGLSSKCQAEYAGVTAK